MTVTSTGPAAWAGVIAMIRVALVVLTLVAASPPTLTVAPTTKPVPVIVIPVPPASGPPFGVRVVAFTKLTAVAAVPPKLTVAPVVKSVPLIVTAVPPASGPPLGVTLVTVGGGTKVKRSAALVALVTVPTVTVTSTVPVPAGLVAVQLVVVRQLTFVARPAAKATVAVGAKSVPVTVTTVPPAVGPEFGETAVTVGGVMKVKQPVQVALWPSTLVTTTLTTPAAWAGVVATTIVASAKVTVPGVPPKLTVSGPAKSLPLIVTPRPPAMEPVFGLTLVTDGGGTTKVKQPVQPPLWP